MAPSIWNNKQWLNDALESVTCWYYRLTTYLQPTVSTELQSKQRASVLGLFCYSHLLMNNAGSLVYLLALKSDTVFQHPFRGLIQNKLLADVEGYFEPRYRICLHCLVLQFDQYQVIAAGFYQCPVHYRPSTWQNKSYSHDLHLEPLVSRTETRQYRNVGSS